MLIWKWKWKAPCFKLTQTNGHNIRCSTCSSQVIQDNMHNLEPMYIRNTNLSWQFSLELFALSHSILWTASWQVSATWKCNLYKIPGHKIQSVMKNCLKLYNRYEPSSKTLKNDAADAWYLIWKIFFVVESNLAHV